MNLRQCVKLLGYAGLQLGLLLAQLLATHGSASAQQYRGQTGDPSGPSSSASSLSPGPSLLGPRLELASGIALILGTFPVAAVVALVTGPPWYSSCEDYDESDAEQDACEREEQEERENGRAAGWLTGLAVGTAGLALTIHGGIRIRRTKAERRAALARLRPASWSVQPLPQRATATLMWRF